MGLQRHMTTRKTLLLIPVDLKMSRRQREQIEAVLQPLIPYNVVLVPGMRGPTVLLSLERNNPHVTPPDRTFDLDPMLEDGHNQRGWYPR